jgi:hypothetical protein
LFFLNIHVFCYLACFSLIPECEKCHEKMNLKIILQFKIDNSVFCRFSQFCNICPQSIAMVNIHDLADKKVSLSCNVFAFFLFFLLQLSQTIIKLSHSNYALTKYNIFCSLHNFILQCNMTIFYKTKLTDKEICKVSEYIKKKISFSAHNAFLE